MGNAVDDAGILLHIKDLFAQNDYKDLLANVEVKVVEGRVLLTGTDLPVEIDTPKSPARTDNLREMLIDAIEQAFLTAARKKWGHLGELEAHFNDALDAASGLTGFVVVPWELVGANEFDGTNGVDENFANARSWELMATPGSIVPSGFGNGSRLPSGQETLSAYPEP